MKRSLITQIDERYAQFNIITQWGIAVILICSWLALNYLIFINPVKSGQATTQRKHEVINQLFTKKTAEIKTIKQLITTAKTNKKAQQLEQDIQTTDKQLATYHENMPTNSHIRTAILRLVDYYPSLTLANIDKKPVQNASPLTIDNEKITRTNYHLQLNGKFADVYHFLAKLCQKPWVILWEKLNYQVSTYPYATIDINFSVYTRELLENK